MKKKRKEQSEKWLGNYIQALYYIDIYPDIVDQVDTIASNAVMPTEDKAIMISPFMTVIRLVDKATYDIDEKTFDKVRKCTKNSPEEVKNLRDKIAERMIKEMSK